MSLAELADAGIVLRPDEVVSIVSDVCRQHDLELFRGTPTAQLIRLGEDGVIAVDEPVNAEPFSVQAAAALLDDLLPRNDAAHVVKSPGALRLVIARASGMPPKSTWFEPKLRDGLLVHTI